MHFIIGISFYPSLVPMFSIALAEFFLGVDRQAGVAHVLSSRAGSWPGMRCQCGLGPHIAGSAFTSLPVCSGQVVWGHGPDDNPGSLPNLCIFLPKFLFTLENFVSLRQKGNFRFMAYYEILFEQGDNYVFEQTENDIPFQCNHFSQLCPIVSVSCAGPLPILFRF